ncbi:MAG TPA: (2Fe-2S)-binding protein [Bacillota bacterium]|jgi:NAD(P)H-nitrite reductase large subunit
MRDDVLVCRCEEVTAGEVRSAIRAGAHTLAAIKKRTRAGMGLCGGRTCARLLARLLAEETGRSMAEIAPPPARPPVRPVPAAVLAEEE